MPTKINNLLKKLGNFLLTGLGVPILGASLTYVTYKLINAASYLILRMTDPSRHCELINHISLSTSRAGQEPDIYDLITKDIIPWDSLPYADFLEWHNYCENFKKIISSVWIVLILGLVIYLLFRSRIWDQLKAAIIAPAIFISLTDDLFFPIGILLIIGLLIFIIRTRKPWYFYFSLVIFTFLTLLFWFLRSMG